MTEPEAVPTRRDWEAQLAELRGLFVGAIYHGLDGRLLVVTDVISPGGSQHSVMLITSDLERLEQDRAALDERQQQERDRYARLEAAVASFRARHG